jgi:dimethylargininase
MRVFDFTHAIVRAPGRSVVHGLRDDPSRTPTYEGVVREHTAYVAALHAAGLTIDVLPPLEDFPDSVFVEDPALVFAEGAILLRPGAPSRLREREAMRGVLNRHFDRVLELDDGEDADGGDVLVTPQTVFIGLSKRTSRAGAEALRARLGEMGRGARIVETPKNILHLKTACALLDEDTILATQTLADSGIFADFDIAIIPESESAAANALRVGDTVFVGEAFPRTADLIRARGHRVVTLSVHEIGKLDAGLSCMSLRWRKA